MSLDIKRSNKDNERIFDRFVDRTFTTETGHKAIFSPTKGGSNTNWQNRVLIVGLEVTHADGKIESYDISAGIIQEITTERKSAVASITVSSLDKALSDLNAEKIKDGDQFHENRKLSFLLNTILVEVFKDKQQNLPDEKRVSSELLTIKTIDNKLGYWSLDTYPGFDGSSFTPQPNGVPATPMTALTTNEDRSIIYVACGGVNTNSSTAGLSATSQDRRPELWQYDIDEDLWTYLATTSGTDNFAQAPIHELFYNTFDEKVYGVIWKDYGDVQSDVENKANKLNWICPPATIFEWSPTNDNSETEFLNDDAHSTDITNYWPGKWDFRMMYPFDHSSKAGASRHTSTQENNATVKAGELETHKLTYGRAGVGNFTSYRYINMPFGPAGQQGFSNSHESRRGTHWMHPQVSGYDDTLRSSTDIFGATTELVPTTSATGVTAWTGAGTSTAPTGWTKVGTPNFSLSSGVLTVTTGTDNDGFKFVLSSPVNNMTVYKLRITGTNFKIQVTNSSTATSKEEDSQVYGPLGMSNTDGYTSTDHGNGDYYFAALDTNAIPGWHSADNLSVFVTAEDHASDLVMTNLSLAIAHHWDNWHNLSRMAAENIPLTHYSKVIGATSIRRPTHHFKGEPAQSTDGVGAPAISEQRVHPNHVGPHQWFYNMFDDSVTAGTVTASQMDSKYRDDIEDNYTGFTTRLNKQIFQPDGSLADSGYTDIEDLQSMPYRHDILDSHLMSSLYGNPTIRWTGQRNEEMVMEFNGIAQDRRNLSQIGSDGIHPMFGPNDLEDGLQPDTSRRHQVGSRNLDTNTGQTFSSRNQGFHEDFFANEAYIADIGPHQATGIDGFGSGISPNAGVQRLNASDSAAQISNQGFGYGSVIVQGLGERAFRESDEEEIYGAVRYTNGQKGCFVFNQEADSGKGVIVFQQFDGTAPADGSRFRWDPDATSGQAGHFNLKWSFYKCDDDSTGDITATNVAPVTRSVSAVTPHSYTVVPIYGTAACSGEDGNIYIATHESRTHSALYTGSNEDDILNRSYIHRVDLGTGAFSAGSVTTTKIYDSSSDASVYNSDMNGSADSGRFANYYASNSGADAANKTRKFLDLHYSSDLSTNTNGTNGLFGTCFKRDSILAEFGDTGVYEPCHEVFAWAGTNNALKVLDHDIQNGASYDAVGFTGFANTTGKFGSSVLSIGSNKGIAYFRLQKASPSPATVRDQVGIGIKVNYLYSPSSGTFNAGNFIDDLTVANTKKLYGNEGMIAHGQAVTGLIDKGSENEREGVFTAFDDYRGWYQTSQRAKNKFAFASIKHFFKIDDRQVDPRVELADFTGLKGFDAISKLATANNMVFGFDVEQFFLINRDTRTTTHTIDGLDGDIINLKKSIDNDIRNVISIQPFRPQVKDIEWEVTHVGGEEVLTDNQLFNGEFTITPNTHREASINLICTRQGRLTKDSLTDSAANAVDSITNLGSRPLIPLFKWRTHAPTKQVILMRDMSDSDTACFVNTLFASGNRIIRKGEIAIFTNPTTFEQVGRVIVSVNTAQNKILLEDTPGFEILANTPINIVITHTGADKTATGGSNITNYGIRYSDEGVSVVTAVDDVNTVHGVCSGGNYSHYDAKSTCEAAGHTWTPVTRLTVNNIRPFAGSKITAYSPENYKHYSYLVTTLPTSQVQTVTLPDQADSADATATTNAATAIGSSTDPTAWVKAIDEENAYIYLHGTYPAFAVGDILNAHYAMAPATLIMQTEDGAIQPPPYTSVQQDLPEGLGTWSWKCDSTADKFNARDIINLKFQGIKLEKDSGSIYTVADATSIARYGQRPWNFPDNRFIRHDKAEYWGSKYLNEFGDPKYAIDLTIAFDPTLTFTTPAGNALRKIKIIDEVMFPGISGFSVTGYIRELANNVKSLTTSIKLRTDEKY